MPEIPRDPSPESSLSLLREGNTFISTRCERYGSDVFKARLLRLRGVAAARLFYDETYFTREDAAPRLLLKTLFGQFYTFFPLSSPGRVKTSSGEAIVFPMNKKHPDKEVFFW